MSSSYDMTAHKGLFLHFELCARQIKDSYSHMIIFLPLLRTFVRMFHYPLFYVHAPHFFLRCLSELFQTYYFLHVCLKQKAIYK